MLTTPNFTNNPVLAGHLDQDGLAQAVGRCRMTITRWTQMQPDPLPYIALPNGERIFNIAKVQAWLARRERGALPTPRRRKAIATA